jgi:hypothetical protein
LSNLRINRSHQNQIKKRRLEPINFSKILEESDYRKYMDQTGVMPTNEKLTALRYFTDIEQQHKLSLLLSPEPVSSSSRTSESRIRKSHYENAFKVTGSFVKLT